MTDNKVSGFFAYPGSPPRISQAITAAVKEINESGMITIKTWEGMNVGGKIIIDEICNEIDRADLFCADLHMLNPNVMFELGYAIAKNKRIWPIIDTTIEKSGALLKQFGTITSIGYANYVGSRTPVQISNYVSVSAMQEA